MKLNSAPRLQSTGIIPAPIPEPIPVGVVEAPDPESEAKSKARKKFWTDCDNILAM